MEEKLRSVQIDYRLSDEMAIKYNCLRKRLNIRAYFHEYTECAMQTFKYFREPLCT